MSTNQDLEQKVTTLQENVSRLQRSNSELRDELAILKSNYTKLVNEMTTRLEVIHNRFQST